MTREERVDALVDTIERQAFDLQVSNPGKTAQSAILSILARELVSLRVDLEDLKAEVQRVEREGKPIW